MMDDNTTIEAATERIERLREFHSASDDAARELLMSEFNRIHQPFNELFKPISGMLLNLVERTRSASTPDELILWCNFWGELLISESVDDGDDEQESTGSVDYLQFLAEFIPLSGIGDASNQDGGLQCLGALATKAKEDACYRLMLEGHAREIHGCVESLTRHSPFSKVGLKCLSRAMIEQIYALTPNVFIIPIAGAMASALCVTREDFLEFEDALSRAQTRAQAVTIPQPSNDSFIKLQISESESTSSPDQPSAGSVNQVSPTVHSPPPSPPSSHPSTPPAIVCDNQAAALQPAGAPS